MFKTCRASLCLAVALAFSAILLHAQNSAQPPKQSDLLKALQYRSIGPYRGGRSAAVAGVSSQPFVYYYGAARSPSLTPIPTRSMLAWASRRSAVTFPTAMVFTSRMMPVRRGSVLVSKTHDKSRAFACIQKTPTLFTSQRWATFGAQTINAASFVQRMVAKRGKRF